jgi:hypothetical protein
VSILKSPLTILGILVIIAAAVLGLGPYFVNWNEHKAEFQRQASLVTGRDVTIRGPLEVRLFPMAQPHRSGRAHIKPVRQPDPRLRPDRPGRGRDRCTALAVRAASSFAR